MATAWITRAVNATDHAFTILQNDESWRPVVHGKQHAKDEPISIPRRVRRGEPWALPFVPGFSVPAPVDMITDLPIQYCIVPWTGFGRLRLVGPNQKWIEYQVGRFVTPDKDHLRGVLSNGETPLMVELGGPGDGWWSASYDFEVYIQEDQGVRWNIQSVQGGVSQVVAKAGELLREFGPEALKLLIG